MSYTDMEIAQVAHAAVRALQSVQGDPAPTPPWHCESPARHESLASSVRMYRDGKSPAEVHRKWVAELTADGWAKGEKKDWACKTHPNLEEFTALPRHQRDKSLLIHAIVRALDPS